MVEIRIHGRGGQGVVVASKVLAMGFFSEGKCVQAFPFFGAERQGAPVTAFVRADDKRIHLRCKIYNPDYLIVLDPNLSFEIDLTDGLKSGGTIIINGTKEPGFYNISSDFKVYTVDASSVASKYGIGSKEFPIVNTAILGAFCKITGLIDISALEKGVKKFAPLKKKENTEAAIEIYNSV
ncbi:2-oxoacid:acceptor oxidoreductase family protein [candidate division KSB1 bacterium]